jgi:uncharacterized linocin/CFP29 family protein
METVTMTPRVAMPPTNRKNRGKDQIHWSDEVWKRIDAAVTEEMMQTRVAAQFLPPIHVPASVTTVPSDVVIVPSNTSPDQALSVDESATTRINEFWVEFRLTPAQEEHEASEEMAMSQGQRVSTGITLATRAANILAQAEDTVLFNGQNGLRSSLFQHGTVQFRDPQLTQHLDLGLLNINPTDGSVALSPDQIIPVHPSVPPSQGTLPRYAENTLGAVAQGFSVLQAHGHYEHYALVLHTIPYADLHTALATTLSTTFEPVSHLIKCGIYGTGTLPPFSQTPAQQTGLPKIPGILYTGVLVSLTGNTMDLVRGLLDQDLDVATTYNQKDVNENYRFRVVERFALRLKDPTAVILLAFLDS